MIDIWNVRNQASAALDSDLKQEKELLNEGFALLDQCVKCFRAYSDDNDQDKATFTIYCCATLVKARRLALSSYSLCLDGLALEAGALMRTLIEGWQILIFFRLDPQRVKLAVDDNMPSAGDIAKAIDDKNHNEIKEALWELRKHYNQFSSHFSLQQKALAPISIFFDGESLRTNMRSLFTVIGQILYETAFCISVIHQIDSSLAERIDAFRENGFSIFGAYEESD